MPLFRQTDSRVTGLWLTIAVLAGLVIGLWVRPMGSHCGAREISARAEAAPVMTPASLAALGDAFARIAERVTPAVVNINTTRIIRRPGHYYNILQRGSESKEIPLQVNTRLPILSISPKNWFLESRKLNGGTELGNYARYYPYGSGSFTYHKVIVLEAYYLSGQQLTLHLGALKDWCRLKINDVFVAEKYAPPWTFDISDFVKEGENKISITVLNNVSNRLAKDVEKFPVRDYGLFGPVKIIPATRIQIEL